MNFEKLVFEEHIWAASSEKGAYGNLKKKLWGTFQLSITMKVFIDFALIPLKIKCYSILQKRLSQYAISQLRIVRSGLHLVTYLNVGNFCDKRTDKTLHAICVQGFLRFSDSNKQSQSVSLIYELA